ncbi:hypothetical protein CEE37_09795 [candidate division LCP-89 bacterium B3_LCP]|uniref:3-deoxy-D-manno-octulosonic acid transferase n=1 Tax=candidate division LCP-89 bacterium B3_LCP TaxID=2012998 RepID=A0A532UYR1_UNCL8|nr:MAG: hypothetical protein CEE37_09795 [candidate division LCP-89 bacterium B3_LCP]
MRTNPFWFIFYNIVVIPLLYVAIQVTRPFNAKVRKGIQEHKGLFKKLADIKNEIDSGRRVVVMHCASAGEFEAARPVLKKLREELTDVHLHVTYFSPSGGKPISQADEVDSSSYLPFDDMLSAKRFFSILKPVAFLIVKHDVWPNMVWAASKQNVPVVWINANLHERSKRLGLLARGLNRSFLSGITGILTVGDAHACRLATLVSPENIEVIGDSRYDRTSERMQQAQSDADKGLSLSWTENKRVIIGGSTWGPDQRMLIPAYATLKKEYADLYLVLVPHEPNQDFLADTEYYLHGFGLRPVRYSQMNGNLSSSDVLIVDKVGILAALYRIAWVAYVGGAFGEGVHSVLEPAVYGLPLFFGPRYYMSYEAESLVQDGAASVVNSPDEMERQLRVFLEDKSSWQRAADISDRITRAGLGATDKIVRYVVSTLQNQVGAS